MAYGFLRNIVGNEVQLEVQRELVTVTGEPFEVDLLRDALNNGDAVLVNYDENSLELAQAF